MNEGHAQLCSSEEWAAWIRDGVVAPLTAAVDLGSAMLEVGPGPGAATGVLRERVGHLVALEVDPAAAVRLAGRFPGVDVVVGDAAEMGFADASFDSVGSFTMLHHVASNRAQDRLLAEARRVLRPGGLLVGSDSLPSNGLHDFHAGDTYNPLDPGSLYTRLATIGFVRITIAVDEDLRFLAHTPEPSSAEEDGL